MTWSAPNGWQFQRVRQARGLTSAGSVRVSSLISFVRSKAHRFDADQFRPEQGPRPVAAVIDTGREGGHA